MSNIQNSLDIPMAFIENSIKVGIEIAKNRNKFSNVDQRDVIKKYLPEMI
jgi:hypothetical protein